MIEGFEFGTLSSWVTSGAVIVGVAGMLRMLARFLPEWIKAKAAERASDSRIAKEIRDELLGRLHDCEIKHDLIIKENEELKQRVMLLEDGDRRKTVALTLLMNEVSRLDPSSDIILRAKAVLELSISLSTPHDPKIDQAIHKLENKE